MVKQVPWSTQRPLQALCLSPTGSWLLCVTAQDQHYILPVLPLLDPASACPVSQPWKTDDVTRVRSSRKGGVPSCATWWQSFDGDNIAIIGTKTGHVQFLDLQLNKVVHECTVKEHVISVDIVQDDSLSLTYCLVSFVGVCLPYRIFSF